MKRYHFDVVIVGGGMVGAAFACALGDASMKVAVLERSPAAAAPAAGYDLRVSAVTLASRNVFEALGAWELMEQRRVSPVRQMRVWEGQYGECVTDDAPPAPFGGGSIHFDAADIGEPCLAYIVENSVILAALLERLHHFTNVHLLCPVEVATIELDAAAAIIRLADGRELRARLLVGADGAQSQVRAAAGIETRGFAFDQKGIVATVDTERSHAETAWQRFLPTGPLAFLPLPEAHICSIVWSADNAYADELLALDDAQFLARLQQAFGDPLGRILAVSQRAAFPLALAHAQAYVASRVALIGDAAHTVHPLAGQGANLGFLDAAALAEVLLDAAARRRDVGDRRLLRRYERWRKGENLAMLAATAGFKQLFGSMMPLARAVRRIGLDVTDAAAPLKHRIMRRASGIEGDLPALARRLAG